jgi:hypothetical protein
VCGKRSAAAPSRADAVHATAIISPHRYGHAFLGAVVAHVGFVVAVVHGIRQPQSWSVISI